MSRLWAGASIAIDIEAGSKFQAKSLTRPVALDVGRHVFFSQLCFEGLLAAAAATIALTSEGVRTIPVSLAVSIGCWAIQLFVLYPNLNRRGTPVSLCELQKCAQPGPCFAAILAPNTPAVKDNVHNLYVAIEAVKVVSLFCV